jgi:hypothetical protein
MAGHGPIHTPRGFEDHKDTYSGFLNGSIALSLVCFFVLVALVAFRFMDNWNVLTGFGGLILGLIATLVALRSGGKWLFPGGLLVLFGLFVAINL